MVQPPDGTAAAVSVVVPNWNGVEFLGECLDSLLEQSLAATVIVVDNGSIDGSVALLRDRYPQVHVILHSENKGFAGGVNAGIRKSLADGDTYVALLNNDAIADKDWLRLLVEELETHPRVGIATSKFVDIDGRHFDSAGDQYTTWGMPHARGRDEPVTDRYDDLVDVFAASGGASAFRVDMLREIGLFDEDFFAYYEDVDLSFRARLAGWGVRYVPGSIAYHHIGATSGRIKGFTTYQTMKNLPWLLWKNAPAPVLFRVVFKFLLTYAVLGLRATMLGNGVHAVRGLAKMLLLLPKKTVERVAIQRRRKVSSQAIWDALTDEMTPGMRRLVRLVRHPLRYRAEQR